MLVVCSLTSTTTNWPPFGNGKGAGKGTYADGMANISPISKRVTCRGRG